METATVAFPKQSDLIDLIEPARKAGLTQRWLYQTTTGNTPETDPYCPTPAAFENDRGYGMTRKMLADFWRLAVDSDRMKIVFAQWERHFTLAFYGK